MIRRGGNRKVADETFATVDETWRENKIHIWGRSALVTHLVNITYALVFIFIYNDYEMII